MKLIKPSFEILEQEPGLDGIYKAIERAGRTCYKSEDKITEDSAKEFVDMLIRRGHTACLEQGTVYLKAYTEIEYEYNVYPIDSYNPLERYFTNKYSKVVEHGEYYYVTTNYRVLYENGWLNDLKYLCKPTAYHKRRITVRFICDRGVMAELTRHRAMSFCVESTRYCNYSLDKFGNELTFIIPSWYNQFSQELLDKSGHRPDGTSDMFTTNEFDDFLKDVESQYLAMLTAGCTPQQARQVLPNALKTEVVMTGFIEDWKHFFDLRCDNAAHPDMRALTIPLKEEFFNRIYI